MPRDSGGFSRFREFEAAASAIPTLSEQQLTKGGRFQRWWSGEVDLDSKGERDRSEEIDFEKDVLSRREAASHGRQVCWSGQDRDSWEVLKDIEIEIHAHIPWHCSLIDNFTQIEQHYRTHAHVKCLTLLSIVLRIRFQDDLRMWNDKSEFLA